MEFSEKLDDLQRRVDDVKSSVSAAAAEDHAQIKRRIDKAQADVDAATKDAKQQAARAGEEAGATWAQMKADASTKMTDFKAHVEKRANQVDAKLAAQDASFAEADAVAAIDYADWAVENAQLAILDAIDARVYADERERIVG